MNKRIFFLTAHIPLIQIVTIVALGGIAYVLARRIEVGTYIGFEASPEKVGTSYLMDIPKEYGADIPKESLGKWCFNKLSGRRWPLIYRDGSYELDIQELGQEEVEELGSEKAKIYVEFRVNKESLLSWDGE